MLRKYRLTLLARFKTYHSISHGRGIWILIHRKCPLAISTCEEITPDIFKIILNDDIQSLGILCIYGPAEKDDPVFFTNLWEEFQVLNANNKLIIGDFNVTLNKDLDRKFYVTDQHKKSRLVINSWIEQGKVSDVFRAYHPTQESFTFKGNRGQLGRLDLCLANHSCLSSVRKIRHIPIGKLSDHHILEVTIHLMEADKGPGSFRANPLIETDENYAAQIRVKITGLLADMSNASSSTKMQAKYNALRKEQLLKKPKDEISNEEQLELALLMSDFSTEEDLSKDLVISHEGALAFVLHKLGNFTKIYQREKKSANNEVISHLQNKLDRLRSEEAPKEEIIKCQTELNIATSSGTQVEIEKHGAFRLLKDERASKELINLERSTSGYTNISRLETTNAAGEEILTTCGKDIRNIMANFFQKIYSPPPGITSNTDSVLSFLSSDGDAHIPEMLSKLALNNNDSNMLEGPITRPELEKQLFEHMKPNSAPGIDGFSVAWVRKFWPQLANLTTLAINSCYEKGELNNMLRSAIMKLLPKGNKNPLNPNSYRPISLLSVFYKMASGAITRRLETKIESLIGPHQVAYSKKRNITTVLINTISAIKEAKKQDEKYLLVSIDFAKAFDSIGHGFIDTVLSLLNFGPSFRRWVKLFFVKRITYLLLNGFFSKAINLLQSVPQGDILSPYIFILVLEFLLLKINHSRNLSGIKIKDVEQRANTYADDSSVLLRATEHNLRYLISILHQFSKVSGLFPNVEKTKVMPLGKTDEPQTLCCDLNLSWVKEITLLGVVIDQNIECLQNNFSSRIAKARTIAARWKRRHLTTAGNIEIAKSMVISQFTHLLPIIEPTPDQWSEIENIVVDLIVRNEKNWISSSLIKTPKKKGGLGFFNLKEFTMCLRVNLLRRYRPENDDLWMKILDRDLNLTSKDDRSKIWNLGNIALHSISKTTSLSCIDLSFETLSHIQLKYPTDPSSGDNSWFNQPLFDNNNVLYNKQSRYNFRSKRVPFSHQDLGLCGLNTTKISDCFANGRVLNVEELSRNIAKNNLPATPPDWMLTEFQHILLSNHLGQLYGCGKVKRGLKICFPGTVPFLNPNPPKFSHSTLGEFILRRNYRPNNLRERISQESVDWESHAQRWNKSLGVQNISAEHMQALYKLVTKSGLSPEIKEAWLRLLQRKTLFGNQIEKFSQKPDWFTTSQCNLCGNNNLLPPPQDTLQHIILRECPMVDSLWNELSSYLFQDEEGTKTQNSLPCPFTGQNQNCRSGEGPGTLAVLCETSVLVTTNLVGLRNSNINVAQLLQNIYTFLKICGRRYTGEKSSSFLNRALIMESKLGTLVRPPETNMNSAFVHGDEPL